MADLNYELLYQQLGQLTSEAPDLRPFPPADETRMWLGRVLVLVETLGNSLDTAELRVAMGNVDMPDLMFRECGASTILTLLHRALARVEMKVPDGMQGAFIPVASPYAAFAAVGRVLSKASADMFIIDPYADEKLLNHFALQVPENVPLRVLADAKNHKPSLKPAAESWTTQFVGLRPLEVRLSPAGSLHDRLLIVDKTSAFNVGQSFNHLASRSATSITRDDTDTAGLKIAHYESLWQSASQL